ncbi:putative N6-adenine methyltransferase-domain-containing protein, partial [Crucibulum laeve]
YSTPFANTLAKHLHDLCTPDTQIAFLCCPTTFVAFQHQNPLKGARLLEYDQRFAVLSPGQFVPYDLDEPEDVPESLKGTVEIAVVDPPFLNEITNAKVAQTLRLILHPTRGRLLLLTSTSIEDVIRQVYAEPPLGPLKKARMEVQHGRLANDFACWGTWEGVENWGEKEGEYTHRGEGWREGDAEGAERTHLSTSGKKSALDGKETEKP